MTQVPTFIDWNEEASRGVRDYVQALDWRSNPSKMYLAVDYRELGSRVGVDEVEFLKAKVDDEINDLLFPGGKYDPHNVFLVGTDNAHKQAKQMVSELNLPHFDSEQVSASPEILKSVLPLLTGRERRVSLELMRPKPSITKMHSQLRGTAATSTSNINVLTKAEIRAISAPVSRKKRDSNMDKLISSLHIRIPHRSSNKATTSTTTKALPSPTSREPHIKNSVCENRRLSLVGESLPAYIVLQLEESTRGSETETTNGSTRKEQGLGRHQSRIKNLVDTSKQMYARTNKVDDTSNKVKNYSRNGKDNINNVNGKNTTDVDWANTTGDYNEENANIHSTIDNANLDHNSDTANATSYANISHNSTEINENTGSSFDGFADEDREYILPQLLTRLYEPASLAAHEDDYYAYSDEDNDDDHFDDDVDYVDLNASAATTRRTAEGTDSEEYLF